MLRLRLGCHHCQGVIAYCYHVGFGNGTAEHPFTVDEAQSLRLAMVSSGKGSRYGEHTLGELLYENSEGVVALNFEKAVMHYRLAAAQGLDEAQCSLGNMYHCGYGVPQNHTEALRLFQLAAAHGLPQALFNVARCLELGEGVPVDVEAARCWYRRAQAGGHAFAENKLRQLAWGDPWGAFPPLPPPIRRRSRPPYMILIYPQSERLLAVPGPRARNFQLVLSSASRIKFI